MADYPILQFSTDAFIADTQHLDATETGAYCMLLFCAWRRPNCDLPDDDKILARFARCGTKTWKRIKPTVMGFWYLDGDAWKQKRLEKERRRANIFASQRATAANARWLKEKNSPHASASLPQCEIDANHNHNHIDISNDISPPPIVPPKTEAKKPTKQDDANEAFEELWEELWNEVPNKVGKKAAHAAYLKAVAKAPGERIMDQYRDYVTYCRNTGVTLAHASTWLNGERWNDEYDTTICCNRKAGNGSTGPPRKTRAERWNETLDEMERKYGTCLPVRADGTLDFEASDNVTPLRVGKPDKP